MSLRDLAVSDLANIVKDDGASGFGCPLVVTSPSGDVFAVVGRSKDIHLTTDPQTGEMISGRVSTVSIVTKDVNQKIIGINKGEPWKVSYKNLNGVDQLFKVDDSYPDSTMGLTTLMLVSWSASE